jgi:hypothetical protein
VTPPAATAAGAARRTKGAAARGPRAAERAKRAAPSASRAVARAARPARSTRVARPARPARAPRIARRVSGPAGGAAALRAPLRRPATAPLGPRLVAFASTLPDRGLVDRLVRGRWWIGVMATLLIGLVAMQVSLLGLNAGMGRAVERSADLERANGVLRAQVSQLEAGERIQEKAAALGMVLPPAGHIGYVRPRTSDASAAARALDEGRFNDPTKAIALPGAVSAFPQPAEEVEEEGAAAGAEGEGEATSGEATEGEATGSGATPIATAGDEEHHHHHEEAASGEEAATTASTGAVEAGQ